MGDTKKQFILEIIIFCLIYYNSYCNCHICQLLWERKHLELVGERSEAFRLGNCEKDIFQAITFLQIVYYGVWNNFQCTVLLPSYTSPGKRRRGEQEKKILMSEDKFFMFLYDLE